jgi:RNA processing factor Prp31
MDAIDKEINTINTKIEKLVFTLFNDMKKNGDIEKYQEVFMQIVSLYIERNIFSNKHDMIVSINNNEVK